MTRNTDHKQEKIAEFIDQNLKKVFADFEGDEMPDQIMDLLTVLRAQDNDLKDTK